MSLLTNTGLWAKGLFVAQVGAVVPVISTAIADPSQLANWKVLAAQAASAALIATVMYFKKSAITIEQENMKPPEEKKTVYVPIPTAALDKPLNGVRG